MAHDARVRAVAYSPDGKYMISGGDDGTARVWLYRSDDLIENACLSATRNLTLAEWQQYVGINIPYQVTCDPEKYPDAIIPEDAQEFQGCKIYCVNGFS